MTSDISCLNSLNVYTSSLKVARGTKAQGVKSVLASLLLRIFIWSSWKLIKTHFPTSKHLNSFGLDWKTKVSLWWNERLNNSYSVKTSWSMAKPLELIARVIFVHTDLYIHAYSQSMHIRQNIQHKFPMRKPELGLRFHFTKSLPHLKTLIYCILFIFYTCGNMELDYLRWNDTGWNERLNVMFDCVH